MEFDCNKTKTSSGRSKKKSYSAKQSNQLTISTGKNYNQSNLPDQKTIIHNNNNSNNFSNNNYYPSNNYHQQRNYSNKNNEYFKSQSKQSSQRRPSHYSYQEPHHPMNNLAPRFQQRAFYSQQYQSDYPSNSWRANLMAASSQQRHYKPMPTFYPLGTRTDPEGAPSTKSEDTPPISTYYQSNTVTSVPPIYESEFERIINDTTDLFSDYGSENSDEDEMSVPSEIHTEWNTASILNHAFKLGDNCNKHTVLSYAVIGAELQSMTKLNTQRTQLDLSCISQKSEKIADNLDKARHGLKELALGLRAFKQDYKRLKKNQNHSRAHLSQSDLSIHSEDLQETHRKSSVPVSKEFQSHQEDHIPNVSKQFYTLSSRSKPRKPKSHHDHNYDLPRDLKHVTNRDHNNRNHYPTIHGYHHQSDRHHHMSSHQHANSANSSPNHCISSVYSHSLNLE